MGKKYVGIGIAHAKKKREEIGIESGLKNAQEYERCRISRSPQGQLPVGPLDVVGGGVAGNAQDAVVVLAHGAMSDCLCHLIFFSLTEGTSVVCLSRGLKREKSVSNGFFTPTEQH